MLSKIIIIIITISIIAYMTYQMVFHPYNHCESTSCENCPFPRCENNKCGNKK